MQEPLASPSRQSGEERLPTLDLVRGVAILMILPANLPFFAIPEALTWTSMEFGRWERWIAALVFLLVQGKFVTLLSILFGAGMAIQADKEYPSGRDFRSYYASRMGILFLLGLAHVLLLWLGDVLTYYAVTGLIALALIRLSQRAIRNTIVALLVWVYLLLALIGILLATVAEQLNLLQPGASVSTTAPSTANSNGAVGQEAESDPIVRQVEEFFSAETLGRVYSEGTFVQRMLYNFLFWAGGLCCASWLVLPYILACFLLGITLQRHGLFRDVGSHLPLLRRMIAGGLIVGLPLHVLALRTFWLEPSGLMYWVWIGFGALALALVYLGSLVLWSGSGRLEWLQGRLRAVGRLALSNYILQSLLCTFVFYGWGLGLYGKVSHAAAYSIVPLVWILSLAVSPLWLRYFYIGPVEWVWRSLAEGRRRPFRRREV